MLDAANLAPRPPSLDSRSPQELPADTLFPSGRGSRRRRVARLLGVLVACAAVGDSGAVPSRGQEQPAGAQPAVARQVDFATEIYPLLRRACFECHGRDKQEADLRLDQRAALVDSGSVVAGKPAESELLRRVALPRGAEGVMPAVGQPLKPAEIAVLRDWIAQGAPWPEQFVPVQHWSYQAPRRPPLPAVRDPSWPQSDLDHFVLARLESEGLRPAPPAAPEVLARRLYLDLIGLPPSVAQLDAFLGDPSPNRIERLVDRLLAQPQFGERWARHWLDLARYADSHGFQRDDFRDIWAYRDWVIRALNDDLPFDQFTIEQLAGDLLPNATEDQRIATGFHRCTPTNVEAGSLPEETRVEQVIDRVNTTGAVWLGTTLECAQCHDHKYDPFSMKDYYRLLAFFNSTEQEADRASQSPSSIKFLGPSMPLSDAALEARRNQLTARRQELQRERDARKAALEEDLAAWAVTFREEVAQQPRLHPLEVAGFQSQGAQDTHKLLDDRSLLLVGESPPAKDVYTIRIKSLPAGTRALRLDALTHPTLPGKGPGRGDAKRRNFVLNEVTAEVAATAGDDASRPRKLAFHRALADFSQQNWSVAGAIDGDPQTGWAISPKFTPHWATLILDQPLTLEPGETLVLQLVQQYGNARTLGRFRLSAVTGDPEAAALPAELAAVVAQPPATWSAAQRAQALGFRAGRDPQLKRLAKAIDGVQQQLDKLQPDTTLVMIELKQPRPSHMFTRGDYRQPGEAVQPGTPVSLHPLPEGPANRLALARWLVSRDNPLVARVTVNRWWAELFGQGIVTTPEDFGLKGDPPTHPRLLDWLAVELMERDWSMKRLLREIVLSATYQQSSQVTPQLLARDDQNRLLARGPRFRLDAEMIRDNALTIAGLVSLRQFGPPIRPFQPPGIWSKVGGTSYKYEVSPGGEKYRRGVYVVIKRGGPYPSFVNFDGTPRLACTVHRSRTNTPLQSLTLLNDPVYVEASKALAARVLRERAGESLDAQLTYAFRLCTARTPAPAELTTLRQLFDAQLARHRGQPGSAEALFPASLRDALRVPELAAERLAAWYSVTTVLMNLHATITKE